MTKIDFRVIPFLCILYLLAFLDRVNIGNARSFGLAKDLNLKSVEYNTALTMFFVPYIIFEIPSNVLLKKLSPRVWLSTCMFCFGLICSKLLLQKLVESRDMMQFYSQFPTRKIPPEKNASRKSLHF